MIKLTRPLCPNSAVLAGGNYKHPDNKKALGAASDDKCMYCESKISHINYAHVEHIKPKASDKYPELEFTWSNLGYACPRCNIAKGDKYDEQLVFINPYEDEPSEHFVAFGSFYFTKNGCERGQHTINEIDLNRPDLVEKRFERLNSVQNAVNASYRIDSAILRDKALVELSKEAEIDKEYSLMIKSFFVLRQTQQTPDSA